MKLILIGAGTYGQVYLSYLREDTRFEVVGFLDDNLNLVGTDVKGIRVLGTTTDLWQCKKRGVDGVIAPIGNNQARVRLLEFAQTQGLLTPNFFHASATISEDATFGQGVYILPGSIIMPYVNVHSHVMISMGVNVAHHTVLHRGVFLSTGVNMGAGIEVGEFASIGIGASIMTGIKSVGPYSVVGAGAVVIRDVPANTTVVGVPAKPLQKI